MGVSSLTDFTRRRRLRGSEFSGLYQRCSVPMNDDDCTARETKSPSFDSHGQAALLLVESLIHGLCENLTLSNNQAVEIIERAVDVQSEQAEIADGAGASMWRSHELLSSILASLKTDGSAPLAWPRLV